MKKKIQPRKRKPSPYVLFMNSNGGTCSLEDLMAAFPAKGKNALLNAMQKLVDNCVRGHQGVLSMSENKNAKTPADGPVAWSYQCGRPYTVTCISSKPQKKEWVGLTDEEIDAAWRSVDYTVDYEQFRIDVARAIEAKLKEKNT
jgi:hypothetical protein